MSELIACHHKVTLDIAKRDVCTIEVVNRDTANILEVNVCENGKEVSLENATLVTITYSNDTVEEMQISEDFKTASVRMNANCLKRGLNFAQVCIYSGDNGLITAEMLTINCKQKVGSDNPAVPDPDMPKLKEMIEDAVAQAGGITPTIGDNGNWFLGDTDTGKPSRGADGKSAYSYAQDGGYTGTEAEFAAKLAAEKLPNPYTLTFTGAVNETYDGSSAKTITIPSGGGSTVNNNTINQYFYNSKVTGKYDLKDGYGTTADIYIAADGTETAISGLAYEVTDYIPVSANTTYVAYCNGYALYDREKTFVSAVIDRSNYGAIKEFTPEQDGYVRITYRPYGGGTTENFNRFCEKSEIKKAPRDYMPAPSSFFDIRIPCNVDLYGDSNSYGYGLSDTANAWANRLGALLLSMPGEVTNGARCEMSVFSGIYSGCPKLGNNGVVYMSAYTDKFTVNGQYITAVDVYIDGVQQAQMTASPAEYTCVLGYHEIELRGSSGANNVINSIATNKTRSFTNHAVTGYNSERLPNTVDGNVEIVMFGTNDRTIAYGRTANNMARFYSACEAAGAKVYFLSPIPTRVDGETDASYVQTISDVISQIPDINYIDVYKDMQLYSLLSTETLYSDKLHLNDLGHKVLFCIVASKLHLAALNSIFDK